MKNKDLLLAGFAIAFVAHRLGVKQGAGKGYCKGFADGLDFSCHLLKCLVGEEMKSEKS